MVHIIFSKSAFLSCRVVLEDKDTLIFMYACDRSEIAAAVTEINKNVEIYTMQNDEELIQAFFNKITDKDLQIRSWY